MSMHISFGIDQFLLDGESYKNLRMAFVTNNAATTLNGMHSRVALLKNQFKLVKLFSPEHGITVNGEDGEKMNNITDTLTGIPVISLYGDKLRPTEEDLRDIDIVLFDIPDIGCRFYTYLWTMTYVMESCAAYNIPFFVLDRPNPIGALLEMAEGPMLDEVNCASFIGRWNIPLKHACTLGELGIYFAATRFPSLQIEVVKVKNYSRHQTAVHDFPFTPTSPAIQNIHAAYLYPGTGLLEGIQVNEGRGTNKPFEQFGAPWIREIELFAALQPILKNVSIKPLQYIPASGIYSNELCKGVSLLITNTRNFQAVSTGISLLQTIIQLYPGEIRERSYKTHDNPDGEKHLDKLLGCENAFNLLKQKIFKDIDVKDAWHQIIKSCLLYK